MVEGILAGRDDGEYLFFTYRARGIAALTSKRIEECEDAAIMVELGRDGSWGIGNYVHKAFNELRVVETSDRTWIELEFKPPVPCEER